MGKSELILKFLDHKPGICYLGKMAPAALQIREFLREAARVLDEPLLSSLSTNSWSEVFALENLDKKVRAYPNTRGATIGKRVFLRKKPSSKATVTSDVIWYGLEDLYEGSG